MNHNETKTFVVEISPGRPSGGISSARNLRCEASRTQLGFHARYTIKGKGELLPSCLFGCCCCIVVFVVVFVVVVVVVVVFFLLYFFFLFSLPFLPVSTYN